MVGDDLCTGSRYFSGLIDEKADPVAAIAERYLERVVCPAKHRGLTGPGGPSRPSGPGKAGAGG